MEQVFDQSTEHESKSILTGPNGVEVAEEIQGIIRINPRCYTDAFIADPRGGADIYLEGRTSRGLALEGDTVLVRINPRSEWKPIPLREGEMQRTGFVVTVVKRNHSGLAGGFIKKHSKTHALFSPTDSRIPRMLVDINECPLDFASTPQRYLNILFVAQLIDWSGPDTFASASLVKIVGDCNMIESKMEIALIENQIFDTDFPPDAYKELEYLETLPDNWFELNSRGRRDLTNECIFTIDPKTARDLDDALSIKQVAEQIYEVGVHIADVSYFVHEMSAVDYYARQRTTSVYLVNRVIPMLPRPLCEHMCSLNPGEPKLTFSVIWKMDKYGCIIDEWFGRTVIKSCAKLTYEQAQGIIDNQSDVSWIEEGTNMPRLSAFNWAKISKSVVLLNKIAKNIRAKRFDNGALKITNVKMKFELDQESGIPMGFSFENRFDSNYLVEEFMLQANMSVAKKIFKHSDKLAFLRRHPPSHQKVLQEVKEFCDAQGFLIDVTSAGSIQRSINQITNRTTSKVVSYLLLRAMKNAEYICAGSMTISENMYSHFALNVPYYTHFTSPIRRYADIIVHRQLASALDYDKSSNENIKSLTLMATECTKRKISAKLISEYSQKLYFNSFVLRAGFCELLACVTRIYDQSFEVILVDYNQNGRVYMNKLKERLDAYELKNIDGERQFVLSWKPLSKKSKRNAEKSIRRKIEQREELNNEQISCRNSLEEGRSLSKISKPRVGELQVIKVFDVIHVVVTVDEKDISKIHIDMKTPY